MAPLLLVRPSFPLVSWTEDVRVSIPDHCLPFCSKALFCIRKAISFEYMNVSLFVNVYKQCVK